MSENNESKEINEIMDFFGRPLLEGEVRGVHLNKVLLYLVKVKNELLDKTYARLAIRLGINKRYIRENYIQGLIYENIIEVYQQGNNLFWVWKGLKGINNNQSLAELNNNEDSEYLKQLREEKKRKDDEKNARKKTE